MRIGVLSDTHGYLDPRAKAALRGVEHILHAGDIGNLQIITDLEAIAPVQAVYGNVDSGTSIQRRFPGVQKITLDGVRIYMTHIGGQIEKMADTLPRPIPHVYIFGHTHVALIETYADVLFLNPGAAGRPRFGGGISVALLDIENGQVEAQLISL